MKSLTTDAGLIDYLWSLVACMALRGALRLKGNSVREWTSSSTSQGHTSHAGTSRVSDQPRFKVGSLVVVMLRKAQKTQRRRARANVVKPGNHTRIVETGRYRSPAPGRVKRGNGPVPRPCKTVRDRTIQLVAIATHHCPPVIDGKVPCTPPRPWDGEWGETTVAGLHKTLCLTILSSDVSLLIDALREAPERCHDAIPEDEIRVAHAIVGISNDFPRIVDVGEIGIYSPWRVKRGDDSVG
jgi:hypothetical protein